AEVPRLIRREGLRRRNALNERRGKEIQRDDLPLRLGTWQPRAIERRRRVALAESAHLNVLAILHGYTAHSLYGLSGVGVGAATDLLARDRAHDTDCGALLIQSITYRSPFSLRRDDL